MKISTVTWGSARPCCPGNSEILSPKWIADSPLGDVKRKIVEVLVIRSSRLRREKLDGIISPGETSPDWGCKQARSLRPSKKSFPLRDEMMTRR
ncbi:hypothetical protein RRG08_017110 [Elysia crispata]|uniref:Uncharacterized protein n=1 Tax=Elysia crispata TaxID=231223 RepID=A0AAE1DKB6_9GAST|nr:hypothetical protein RRG08_017110 [Elysia crispata]